MAASLKKRAATWAGALAAAVALYAIVGYLLLPAVARGKLEEVLSAELARPVRIERLELDPFALRVTVAGVSVGRGAGREGSLFAFERLVADVSWRSLWERAPVIDAVRLVAPRVVVAREADGRYDVDDLVRKILDRPRDPNEPPARFALANVELERGQFDFEDLAMKATHRVTEFELSLPFASSLPVHQQIHVHPKIAAKVNGTAFSIGGRSRPFSATRESTLEIDVAPVDLAPYVPYLPVALPVTVRSLVFGGHANVDFEQPAGGAARLAVRASAELAKIDVRERGGEPLAAIASVKVDAMRLMPLERVFEVGRVAVSAPTLTVHRREGQARFFETVLAALEASRTAPVAPPAGAPSPAAAGAARWTLGEFVVDAGQLDFLDAAFEPRPLALKVDAIAAKASGIDSGLATPIPFSFAAEVAAGTRVEVSGSATPSPLAVQAKASIGRLALAPWWWIAQPHLRADLVDGTLDARADVVVETRDGAPRVRVAGLGAELRSLALCQRWDGRDLLKLASLVLEGVDVDPSARVLEVGAIRAERGALALGRDPDGAFNVEKILAPEAAPRSEPRQGDAAGKPAAGPHAKSGRKAPDTAPAHPADKPADKPADAPPAWSVGVGRFALQKFALAVRDAKAGPDADLELTDLSLTAERLSTAPGRRGQIALAARVGRTGALRVRGPVGVSPPAGALHVDVRDVSILPIQPYFAPYVNLVVSSGRLSSSGEVAFDLRPSRPPHVHWAGEVSVADFDAVTKAGNDELLRWKTLRVSGVDVATEPMKIDVGEIALSDFYSRLVISPEGRFNLQDVMVAREGAGAAASTRDTAAGASTNSPPAAGPAASSIPVPSESGVSLAPAPAPPAPAPTQSAASAEPPPPLRIGRIVLANGNVDFSDFFVKPNYSANLTGVGGTIGTLTPQAPGDIELRGRVDNAGSVEITGKLNPLAPQLFLDLAANARDIDLPRTSPYAVRYLGYGIEKGKLSAKVKYRVENRRLQAENNIVLDQLTFGEKVDSPTATKLPVLFAVALLKDRHGVIDVNLPIGGSLDDPQFSVGGIVVRIILNLIVKAVTAPFSLLAGLAGGGPELSFLEFAPGVALVADGAQERLKSLAKALADRPGLKLELSGRADPGRDRDALRKRAFERALKAQKVRELARGAGGAPPSIDQAVIEPAEYAKYLAAAYRAGDFPKPRNALGVLRDVPVPEMERMLSESLRVGDDDLRDLALHRAEAAKEWLATQGAIAGERLFVVAPKLTAEGLAAGASAARVDLSLK